MKFGRPMNFANAAVQTDDMFGDPASYIRGLLESPPSTVLQKIHTGYKHCPLWKQFQLLEFVVDMATKEPNGRVLKEGLMTIFLHMLHELALKNTQAHTVREVLWTSLFNQRLSDEGTWKYPPGFEGLRTTIDVIEELERA
ncbi:TPA: hypothetical protein DIV48_03680 [Candidatus Kaiserbacteria bacterium]|nr:hypothetical protein [Candidatus Kaiserbacteria bacterium]